MKKTQRNHNTLESQPERAIRLLGANGIMRTSEFLAEGIAEATIQRLRKKGAILQLSRGLYQRADADLDANHDLAEAAKRLPKGVVCLTSALAFYDLTDQLPAKVWMAIPLSDWSPIEQGPMLRITRMSRNILTADVEVHRIEGVEVKIFSVARTVVDCFRHRKSVGLSVAIEALREALQQRKTTPGEIARIARARRAWTLMQPYLEALTAHG